jgi:hypothetical protein
MTRAHHSPVSKSVVLVATVTVWLVACLWYELHRISAILALPADGDLYAHNWGFQLLVFAMFRFPMWLVGLLIIVVAEFLLLNVTVSRAHQDSRA